MPLAREDKRMGLYELLCLARDYWMGQVVVLGEQEDREAADADLVKEALRAVVDETILALSMGNTMRPGDIVRNCEEAFEWALRDINGTILLNLDEFPPWVAFCEACDLAGRITGLVDVLEGERVALARTCRDDLDGLLVLADWCEDAGRPTVAAEARHLHGLVRHFRALFAARPAPLVLRIAEMMDPDSE
jgi:hypothetical protein